MAKYAGLVGYSIETETTPGVWSATETVRRMRGDVLSNGYSYNGGDKINNSIALQHRISLVGDSYLLEHYHELRWIEIHGVKWEVASISIYKPRFIITLGDIYNGQ